MTLGPHDQALDGGPDRIRTGDLERDRLACLATTPRARGSDTVAEHSRDGKHLQKADPDRLSPTSRMTTMAYAPAPTAAATAEPMSISAWSGDATALVPAAAPSAMKVAARTAERRIPAVEPHRRRETTPITTST